LKRSVPNFVFIFFFFVGVNLLVALDNEQGVSSPLQTLYILKYLFLFNKKYKRFQRRLQFTARRLTQQVSSPQKGKKKPGEHPRTFL
jgi:hypothetical protein